jgi:apolipoprotein D and lipocalin family protein
MSLRPLSLLLAVAACAHSGPGTPPLRTVERVDLDRYMGTWYEIASFPQSFQKGCVASTADYTLRPDGEVTVLNRCRDGSFDGKERSATGRAWVVDPQTNARLEVSFFWPFRGDYWIIDLDPEYRWAVVGAPNRKYLWILARQRTLDEAIYQGIVSRAQAQGFEPSRLQRTPQPPAGG